MEPDHRPFLLPNLTMQSFKLEHATRICVSNGLAVGNSVFVLLRNWFPAMRAHSFSLRHLLFTQFDEC